MNYQRNCTLTGSADAKGENGRIQVGKAVFRWEMLLFYPPREPVSPLENAKTALHVAAEAAVFPLERAVSQRRNASPG
jgi:hypothetical protein